MRFHDLRPLRGRADALGDTVQTINRPKPLGNAKGPGSGKGPLSTKSGTIAAALLAAALAAAAIFLFINQYKDKVDGDTVRTRVMVSAKTIEKGTSGDTVAALGLIEATNVPKGDLKPGAITDASALKGKLATREILPGSQLTGTEFATADNDIVTKLAPDQRALTLPVDRAHGMVGTIKPGDHVDIIGGFLVDTGVGRPRPLARNLVQDVLVLKVPNVETGAGGKVLPSVINEVTVRLGNRLAPKVAFVAEYGKLWVALRPANGTNVARTSLTTIESLMFGDPATARSFRRGAR
jgi:Flp pilus assembly protein CpaB